MTLSISIFKKSYKYDWGLKKDLRNLILYKNIQLKIRQDQESLRKILLCPKDPRRSPVGKRSLPVKPNIISMGNAMSLFYYSPVSGQYCLSLLSNYLPGNMFYECLPPPIPSHSSLQSSHYRPTWVHIQRLETNTQAGVLQNYHTNTSAVMSSQKCKIFLKA